MSAIFFDLDGVLYEGERAIDGAAAVVSWSKELSIPHLFLTNTSSRPRTTLVEKLASFDIDTNINEFLTPPVATVQWLKQNHANACITLFIPEATKEEFHEFNIYDGSSTKNIDALIVGDLGTGWGFATLNRAFTLLMNNPDAELIALGMTRYWRSDNGLQLDAGPYVKALEYATGRAPLVLGKPALGFFEAGLKLLNCSPDDAIMIGDDIRGDIEAAQNAGIRAILVKTGKYKPEDLKQNITPDAVINSIAGFPDWWKTNKIG